MTYISFIICSLAAIIFALGLIQINQDFYGDKPFGNVSSVTTYWILFFSFLVFFISLFISLNFNQLAESYFLIGLLIESLRKTIGKSSCILLLQLQLETVSK